MKIEHRQEDSPTIIDGRKVPLISVIGVVDGNPAICPIQKECNFQCNYIEINLSFYKIGGLGLR